MSFTKYVEIGRAVCLDDGRGVCWVQMSAHKTRRYRVFVCACEVNVNRFPAHTSPLGSHVLPLHREWKMGT